MQNDLFKNIVKMEREFRTKEFLAPYTEESKIAIIKMDGLNYRFHIGGFSGSGIGKFIPISPTYAEYTGEADQSLVRSYFNSLLSLRVILCYETNFGWVAYPASINVARNKFSLDGELVVKNAFDNRFDVVLARFDGLHFWSDGICPTNSFKSKCMRDCFVPKYTPDQMREALKKIPNITPEDNCAFELAISSAENILNEYLTTGGGSLTSYIVQGPNIEIKWKSAAGNSYTSLVDKESLDVISTGVCLTNDTLHLKDLPFLAESIENYRVPIRNIDFNGIEDF
jgi:hypothetical protein